MPALEKRRIGRTSVEVTVLGLGCATLGGSGIDVSRETAEAIVRAAWAAGVSYIDTAPYYGFGQAERCVGDAMRWAPRDEWVLSTKVGRLLRPRLMVEAAEHRRPMPFDAVYDYSYDGIMRSFEDSLQRLGLARIDILYVHDIGALQHGDEAHPGLMRTLRDSGYRALEELRAGGVVRRLASASTSARYCSKLWNGGTGTRSFSPGAIPFSNRRRSRICCPYARRPAPLS